MSYSREQVPGTSYSASNSSNSTAPQQPEYVEHKSKPITRADPNLALLEGEPSMLNLFSLLMWKAMSANIVYSVWFQYG